MRKRIILTATGGGHLEQLKQLSKLEEIYDVHYVLSKISTNKGFKNASYVKHYRIENKVLGKFDIICVFIKSFFLLLKYKPDFVISTGSAVTYPLCFLQKKFFRRKVIFIESFAKRTSGTKTGIKIYRFADKFIVQWKEMLKVYPNAIYGGPIY